MKLRTYEYVYPNGGRSMVAYHSGCRAAIVLNFPFVGGKLYPQLHENMTKAGNHLKSAVVKHCSNKGSIKTRKERVASPEEIISLIASVTHDAAAAEQAVNALVNVILEYEPDCAKAEPLSLRQNFTMEDAEIISRVGLAKGKAGGARIEVKGYDPKFEPGTFARPAPPPDRSHYNSWGDW